MVVPAHNEEHLVGRVIETMPDFVDKIIVVTDASADGTAGRGAGLPGAERVVLLDLEENRGVGGAIAQGVQVGARARARDLSVTGSSRASRANRSASPLGKPIGGRPGCRGAEWASGSKSMSRELAIIQGAQLSCFSQDEVFSLQKMVDGAYDGPFQAARGAGLGGRSEPALAQLRGAIQMLPGSKRVDPRGAGYEHHAKEIAA